MKAVHGFILEPLDGKLYSQTRDIGGIELHLSTSLEDAKSVNRVAQVISVPSSYNGPILDGGLVVVHHNVFRKYYDVNGKERFSTDLVKDKTYVVHHDSIYMYKNDVFQEWEAIDPYCFVTPSSVPLHGTIKYSNNTLRSVGIDNGDDVCFTPDCEYEFYIDEEMLYRIHYSDIWLKKTTK